MAIPFTIEQFHGVFRDYNTAVWPAQLFLLAMAGVALIAFALVWYPVWSAYFFWQLPGNHTRHIHHDDTQTVFRIHAVADSRSGCALWLYPKSSG